MRIYCPTLGRNQAPKGAGSFPVARCAYEKSSFVLDICCPSLILGLGARQLGRSDVSGHSSSGSDSSDQPGRCPAADESEYGPGHACLPRQRIRPHHQGRELPPSRRFHDGRFSRHRPDARVGGHAKVDGKAGRLAISVELTHLPPASSLGGQYLTYVLWAITPEGRAVNLGEVLPGEGGKDKIDVTTDLQAFGLIVTAEPYYSVVRPSNKVVAENILRQETKGFEEPIDAKFDVLEGSQYTIDVPAEQLPAITGRSPTLLLICSRRAMPWPSRRPPEPSNMLLTA